MKTENTLQKINYDMLIIACGAENATFGIKGVKEYVTRMHYSIIRLVF